MSDSDKSEADRLAEQRIDWAEDRTKLAIERTFASWMRTGMACVGLALGLKAVFGSTDHPFIAKAVAELFVVVAVIVFGSAAWRSFQAQQRIDEHDTSAQSHIGMIITAATLAVGALTTGVILWLL